MVNIVFNIIFIGLCLTIGGNKTAKSLVSLGGNMAILAACVSLIYIGVSPLFCGIVACVAIATVSLFYQNGVNRKTVTSFVSLISLLFVLGIVGYLLVVHSNLQGFPLGQNSIRESNGYSETIGISMVFVEMAVILIVLEGALVDTSLSVMTSIYEVYHQNKNTSTIELFEAGMSVGRNILNSTVNTLFFIFLGQEIVFFAYYENDYTFLTLINSKALLQPVLEISLAAIGCVLIIPLTSYIGSFAIKRWSR